MSKQMNKSAVLKNVCKLFDVFWRVVVRSQIQATVILCFLNCFVIAEAIVFICCCYSLRPKSAWQQVLPESVGPTVRDPEADLTFCFNLWQVWRDRQLLQNVVLVIDRVSAYEWGCPVPLCTVLVALLVQLRHHTFNIPISGVIGGRMMIELAMVPLMRNP